MNENNKTTIRRKPKGEGSVYQTKDGRWIAKIPPSIETNNKVKKFTGKTRAKVVAKMNEFKSTLKSGLPPQNDEYFKEYIEQWLYNVKFLSLKPTSFDRTEGVVKNHIIPELGNYKLKDITADLIQNNIINKLFYEKKLSYSSIKKAHDILLECLRYAQIRQHIYINPMPLIQMPSKDKFKIKQVKFFDENEIKLFIESCESKFIDGTYRFKYGFGFIFMMYSGLRAGELLNLKWSDIDFDNKVVIVNGNVVTAKDRSQNIIDIEDKNIKLKYKSISQNSAKTIASTKREIYLIEKAIESLKSLKALYIKEFGELPIYVISKDVNTSITISTFSKSFDKIIKRAGICKCSTHTLRHTFASLLFKKGVDVKIVSELLGHSGTDITYKTYVHLIKEQKREAMDLLNNI